MAKEKGKLPNKLSEGTRKSNTEFAEMNSAYSLLYNRFKKVIEQKWSREYIDRFQKLLLAIIRSGPVSLTGERRLWDGDVDKLLHFELNPETGIHLLFAGKVDVSIQPGKKISVKAHPFIYDSVFRTHKDGVVAYVKMFILFFDLINKTSEGKSIVVFNQPVGEDLLDELELDLPIPNVDNSLILVVKQVYFMRRHKEELSIIQNKRYKAANIVAVAYIKNGVIASYQPDPKVKNVPKPPDAQGVWMDLD